MVLSGIYENCEALLICCGYNHLCIFRFLVYMAPVISALPNYCGPSGQNCTIGFCGLGLLECS